MVGLLTRSRCHQFLVHNPASMRWKIAVTARTTKKNRAATTMPRRGLEHYCPDLNGWQRSWMGLEKDLPLGEPLITLFRPFLVHLAASILSAKTVQKHVGNLWALGGEFIRNLHIDPSPRKRPVEQVLLKMTEYGGRSHTTAVKISRKSF
jgi:hypothetical protein